MAPEVLISKYWGDIEAVSADFERLSQLATDDGVPWSKTHSFFANLGGFAIQYNVPERAENLSHARTRPGPSDQSQPPLSVSEGQESDTATMPFRSVAVQPSAPPYEIGPRAVELKATALSSEPPCTYHLTALDLITLRDAGLISRLPYVTTAELKDRSKSDSFVRIIAIIQILWIVIQIIVRLFRHLAVSQLEVAVMSFAICAMVIYGQNWNKPNGVQVPYTLIQYKGNFHRVAEDILKKRNEEDARGTLFSVVSWALEALVALAAILRLPAFRSRGSQTRFPNHWSTNSGDSSDTIGLFLGAGLFGAVHILAWNFAFPTAIERTLWRASSLVISAGPLLFLTFCVLAVMFENVAYLSFSNNVDLLLYFWIVLFLCYPIARLFILVEIFRTLCFLPPSAYVATWASNLPHVA